MLDIGKVYRDERQLKAVIGMSRTEFNVILPVFSKLLLEESKNKDRQRAVGGGRKGTLLDEMYKLFFILLYIKVYPTFDFAGFIFGVHRTRCCQWSLRLLPLLEKALGRSIEMPKRKISSLEEFLKAFPGTKDLFIDGTERRVQRSKVYKKQAKNYSGKKKAHTRKNIIACDEHGKILLVSPTKGGKTHDLTCFKKWCVGDYIPEEVVVWADKGFTGIKKVCNSKNCMIPHKKKKGKELSSEERADNKVISGLRIVVEHAIGGIKRLGCMSGVYRNRKGQDDQMLSISAGIWNLHLQTRVAS